MLLSESQSETLDRDGFVRLPGLLSPEQVRQVNNRLAALFAAEGDQAGADSVGQEVGADRLANLVDKGEVFDTFYTHPQVLACVSHVLGPDIKLFSLNHRSPRPGAGHQPLHPDWVEHREPGQFYICNSIWCLDDFTEHNGATRIAPGTHRGEPTGPEAKLLAAAGTVFVFNGHLLHGGTDNATDRPRRAMHAAFTRRDQTQQTDQRTSLSSSTVSRLTDTQRWILDV